MKYYQAIFTINPYTKDACDILSALAGEAGFESFEDVDGGLKGYVQVEKFDKEALDTSIDSFPIEGVKITYDISEVETRTGTPHGRPRASSPSLSAAGVSFMTPGTRRR